MGCEFSSVYKSEWWSGPTAGFFSKKRRTCAACHWQQAIITQQMAVDLMFFDGCSLGQLCSFHCCLVCFFFIKHTIFSLDFRNLGTFVGLCRTFRSPTNLYPPEAEAPHTSWAMAGMNSVITTNKIYTEKSDVIDINDMPTRKFRRPRSGLGVLIFRLDFFLEKSTKSYKVLQF
jgi:hypothetical protein